MELYKYINNEALSEDNKAKRIVMERIRKNLIDTQQSSFKEIVPAAKRAFLEQYYIFTDGIDGMLYDGEDGVASGDLKDVGRIPSYYNKLALTIQNMEYNILNPNDRQYINEMMDKTVPKLINFYNAAVNMGVDDAFQIKMIIDNIQGRLFKPIFYPEQNLRQPSRATQTERPRLPPAEMQTQTGDNDEDEDEDEDEEEDENQNEGPEQEEIEQGQQQDEFNYIPDIQLPQAPPPPQVVDMMPQWTWADVFGDEYD